MLNQTKIHLYSANATKDNNSIQGSRGCHYHFARCKVFDIIKKTNYYLSTRKERLRKVISQFRAVMNDNPHRLQSSAFCASSN
jgi:hypothetical protein